MAARGAISIWAARMFLCPTARVLSLGCVAKAACVVQVLCYMLSHTSLLQFLV